MEVSRLLLLWKNGHYFFLLHMNFPKFVLVKIWENLNFVCVQHQMFALWNSLLICFQCSHFWHFFFKTICDPGPQNQSYSFFQFLTSFCPICSHIFKTLNTINTTSVCCSIPLTQLMFSYNTQSINMFLKCSFHTSLPHTKIMDPSYLFYKSLNTACQEWRPYVPNVK